MSSVPRDDLTTVMRETIRLVKPFWALALIGTGIGVLSGLATAWLLATINQALHEPAGATWRLLAGFAGLGGDQGVAQHLLGVGDDFLDRAGQAHAALGVGAQLLELTLAAAAGVDLALHHIERTRQRLGGGLGLVDAGDRNTLGDRRAVLRQNSLGLVFVDIHESPGARGLTVGALMARGRRRGNPAP